MKTIDPQRVGMYIYFCLLNHHRSRRYEQTEMTQDTIHC